MNALRELKTARAARAMDCLGFAIFAVAITTSSAAAAAQAQPAAKPAQPPVAQTPAGAPASGGPSVPADYTIGTEDVLSIVFWRESEMSAEPVVRPDGKISLPLLNEITAVGLTPAQLRASIEEQAKKFVQNPSVTVVVKQINSRRVFITGNVARAGLYNLTGQTTVLQLIAMAGGLLEYADSKNIVITRTENGRPVALKFNYKDIIAGKNLQSNVVLKPGDVVVIP